MNQQAIDQGNMTDNKHKTAEPTAVALGGNMGDRLQHLRDALTAIQKLPECRNFQAAPIYASEPVDCGDAPPYLNTAVKFETTLSPSALLAHLQAIENAHGRRRPYRNAPRTLDLDILLFGRRRIDAPSLQIPHPRMHTRLFVLVPLADIWPEAVLPNRQKSVKCLLEQCLANPQPGDHVKLSTVQWPVEHSR